VGAPLDSALADSDVLARDGVFFEHPKDPRHCVSMSAAKDSFTRSVPSAIFIEGVAILVFGQADHVSKWSLGQAAIRIAFEQCANPEPEREPLPLTRNPF
jgi:hypothetical protein